jgi:hypothetical protein
MSRGQAQRSSGDAGHHLLDVTAAPQPGRLPAAPALIRVHRAPILSWRRPHAASWEAGIAPPWITKERPLPGLTTLPERA